MATPIKTTTSYVGYLISTSYSESDYGESANSITETWLIKKKDVISGEPPLLVPTSRFLVLQPEVSIQTMASEAIIPTIGIAYDDWVAGRSPAMGTRHVGSWYKKARLLSRDMTHNKDGSLTCIFIFANRKKTSLASETLATHLGYYPPTVEAVAGMREMELFRRNPSTVAPSGADTSADIGGTAAITGARQGIMVVVPQLKLRVRRAVDVYADNGAIKDIIAAFDGMIGTRNSAAFMGYATGKLVSEGFNLAKLETSYYELVFDFIWDANFEHSQVAEHEKDGIPKMDATGTNFSSVIWTRPTRATFEFNNIFFEGTAYTTPVVAYKNIAEKGYWT